MVMSLESGEVAAVAPPVRDISCLGPNKTNHPNPFGAANVAATYLSPVSRRNTPAQPCAEFFRCVVSSVLFSGD